MDYKEAFAYAKKHDDDYKKLREFYGDMTFTSADKLPCGVASLSTLRKHGIVTVDHAESFEVKAERVVFANLRNGEKRIIESWALSNRTPEGLVGKYYCGSEVLSVETQTRAVEGTRNYYCVNPDYRSEVADLVRRRERELRDRRRALARELEKIDDLLAGLE